MNKKEWIELFNFCESYGVEPVAGIVIGKKKKNGHYLLIEPNDGHFIPTEAKLILDGVKHTIYLEIDKLNREKSLRFKADFQAVHKSFQFVESNKI